jgi:MYXO-CTERM domain-containing protein
MLACRAEGGEGGGRGEREKELGVLLLALLLLLLLPPLLRLLLLLLPYVINTYNEGGKVVPSVHGDFTSNAAVAETGWRDRQQRVTTDTARIKGLRRPVSITPTTVLVGAWVQTHNMTKQ